MKTPSEKLSRRALLSAAAAVAATEAEAQTNPTGLDAAIDQSHRALRAILNGNPKLYEELFAKRDDITLGNPFGPFGRGPAQVAASLARAAGNYRDGEVVNVELVAKYANTNLACIVEVERSRARVGASNEFVNIAARVTSLYELIDGKWKLVHRHADPITTVRPAESVIQK